MEEDKLVKCPHCGSDACYENQLDAETTMWLCYTCGFTANSQITEGSQLLEISKQNLPELYKDLLFTNEDKVVWYPCTVNNPEQGMVFMEGTSPEDVKWVAMKTVEIDESEKSKFPIPGTNGQQFYKRKVDTSTKQEFDKLDFNEALIYLDIQLT